MAETVSLDVQERNEHGTRVARRLRSQGRVPGVVYGHGEGTVSITVSGDDLSKAVRHGVRLYDLKRDGNVEKVMIKDLQWDPLGHDILHVDFARISADERVEVTVPLVLRGTAPGVTGGGVLVQSLHELSVECLATAIPDSIRVNLGDLQRDEVIHVRDLTLPEGVVVQNDPDAVVVQVTEPAAEEEAAAPGTMAEPEVIGRPKSEEEEGE